MENYQRVLFPYAYNILGSSDDAKDAIQEAMSRYMARTRSNVQNEKNYLIKTVINCSIKIKNKKRKEVMETTHWLPEPVATNEAETGFNVAEVAPFALLVQLEKLTARERAVFILKEGFDYSHEEIARVISGTVESSRKLLSRAKEKLKNIKARENKPGNLEAATEVVQKLLQAIQAADVNHVAQLLADDVAFYADGGHTIKVIARQLSGKHAVEDILLTVHRLYNKDLQKTITVVNHQPAILYFRKNQLLSCQVFELANNKVIRISSVLDPQKLQALSRAISVTGTDVCC